MERELFEKILMSTQAELKEMLAKELKAIGYKPATYDSFLYAEGDAPVLLIAHMDTVHTRVPTPSTLMRSIDGRIWGAVTGVGGDDRCGVYMILQIIKKHRCHVLFCEDEEIGAVGARAFVKKKIKPKVNYIVELDRRGSNDAVFYDCDNREFVEFVKKFGFEENYGSFSDISVIAPALKTAAVNISAGYYNEHTSGEYIDTVAMDNNIMRVSEMVSSKSAKFKYIKRKEKKTSLLGTGLWPRRWNDPISVFDDIDDIDLFDEEYYGYDTPTIVRVMYAPLGCYIMTDTNEYILVDKCNFGVYLIDEDYNVYECVSGGGGWQAVMCDYYVACSISGNYVPWEDNGAFEIEVIDKRHAADIAC